MKNISLFLFAAFISVSCSKAQSEEFTAETLAAQLQSASGETTAFSEILEKHKGKTLVIEFWASWCSDCVKAMPKLKTLQADHPEAQYVFISLDKTAEKWKAGIDKHQIQGDHYLITDPDGMKGKFGKSVNLDWIPRYMVVDKNGKIALYRAIETDFDAINTTLKNLK